MVKTGQLLVAGIDDLSPGHLFYLDRIRKQATPEHQEFKELLSSLISIRI
jgi:hypothetical protein